MHRARSKPSFHGFIPRSVVVFAFTAAVSASAAAPTESQQLILQEAVLHYEESSVDLCSFTRIHQVSNESEFVERHEIIDGQSTWTLLSVNGEPPAESDLTEFEERLPGNIFENLMVRPDLVADELDVVRSGTRLRFSADGINPDSWAEVPSELGFTFDIHYTVDAANARLLEFSIANSKPFRQRVIAKVDTFRYQAWFRTEPLSDVTHWTRTKFDFEGRVFFKSFGVSIATDWVDVTCPPAIDEEFETIQPVD